MLFYETYTTPSPPFTNPPTSRPHSQCKSVSGTVPEIPVVSKKSGHLFEKRLIEKIIQETGRCPVTNEPLESEDLIPLAASKAIKPRPTPATSIPGLLMLFQDEWDATVLETHQLRQSLHATRQELSHALYQHDAATRVVARLLREKETLRQQLEAAAATATATGSGVAGKRGAGDVHAAAIDAPSNKKPRGEPAATAVTASAAVGGGLPSQVVAEITKKGDDMQIYRKKRIISSTVATPDQLSSQLKLSSTAPLHQTSKGGINFIAVSTFVSPPSSPDDNKNSVPVLVATAGNDTTVRVYEPSSGREVTSLRGHSKKVLSTSFLGNNQTNVIITGAADGTSRIWRQEDGGGGGGKYECAHTFQHGTGTGVSVVATPVHATGNYYLSAGSDGHLCYNDIQQRQELVNITACEDGGGLTSAAFHPDGVIFGLGDSSSVVKIYDARSLQVALTMTEHSNHNNKGGVTSLSFSENGYLLASAASDSVKVWDLRKGTVAKQTLDAASVVSFDYSGLYLAAGGGGSSALKVYGVKQGWGTVVSVNDEGVIGSGKKKGVCAVAWGVDAKTLYLGGLDHNLRILSI